MHKAKVSNFIKRAVASVLMAGFVVSSIPMTALAGAGSGGGSGGGSSGAGGSVSYGQMAYGYDERTILKILPMQYGSEGVDKDTMISRMENPYDRYYDDWFAIYMTLGDNPVYSRNNHAELILYEDDWYYIDTTFGDNGGRSRYIESYIGKPGWTNDAQYFYDITKSATYYNGKTHTPAGHNKAGNSSTTPIGETLNSKIRTVLNNPTTAKRYVDGYTDVLQLMFGDIQDWDFAKAFTEWINANYVSIGFETLQGFYDSGSSNDTYFVSTTAVAYEAFMYGTTSIEGHPYKREGAFLRAKSGRDSLFGYFASYMKPFRGGASNRGQAGLVKSLYPALNGQAVTDFGGWAFFDVTDKVADYKDKVFLIEQNEYYLGDSRTEQPQYGQNGLVYVEDIATSEPKIIKDIEESAEVKNTFKRSLTSSVKLNSPVNGTEYKASTYCYRIVDAATGTVIKDWTDLGKTTFSLDDINLNDLKAQADKVDMFQIELNGIYYGKAGDYAKTAQMPQNKLTHLFKSLGDFSTKGIHKSISDDRYTDKRAYTTLQGMIEAMGTKVARTQSILAEFTNYADVDTKSSNVDLGIAASTWDTNGTMSHDTSVYVSRATLNDKPVLSSFANNDIDALNLLKAEGFSTGNKGRDLSAGTTPLNSYLGFVRSKSTSKTMSTADAYYKVEQWDSDNETTAWVTKYKPSTAAKSSVDTQLNVGTSRYVTSGKTSYKAPEKDGYVEYNVSDTGLEVVQQSETDLQIYPTVEMEYDTKTGTTKEITVMGDVKKPIKPISYSTLTVTNPKVTVDSTAYASDSRAVQLSASNDNAPVFLKGGGIIASYSDSSLNVTSYVLDIGNTSLKNAWGNGSYNAKATHNAFASNFENVKMAGLITIENDEYEAQAVDAKLSKDKETQKAYAITVKDGKITDLGGLPEAVAKKMRLTESIESVLAKGEGQGGWYNESTNVLVVREFNTSYKIPPMTLTDKVPLEFGPESPIDKNMLFSEGDKAWMNSRFSFKVTTKVNNKTYTKDVTFRTNRESGKVDFVIPNASVLDGTF